MIKNYLKIAWRNLVKYKFHTFINLFGLATGIASAILIFLFVRYELSYDRFHKNADDIYLVQKYRNLSSGLQVLDDTWIPLLNELKHDYPEVRNGVRLFTDNVWIEADHKKFRQEITFADPSVFEVFTFPLASGDQQTVLKDRHSLVLSEEMARKFFGQENPVGKILKLDFEEDFVVTGVFKKTPENSSIPMGILAPFESAIDPTNEELNGNWDGAFLYTYVQLRKNKTAKELESRLPGLVEKIWGTEGPNGSKQLTLKLLPMTDLHDAASGSRSFAYILISIALAILIIASFNFMNLSTARSLERLREIGIRKVFGAERRQLIGQFLGESLVITFIALIAAVCIAVVVLPAINRLYNISLTPDFLTNPFTLTFLILTGLVVGIFSGIYPALMLSRSPVVESVKKTSTGTGRSEFFRKVLVTVQFALTIILVIGTAVVWKQTVYMKNHNLNFQKDNVMVIPMAVSDFPDRTEAVNRIDVFKKVLLNNSGVQSVSSSMSVPGDVTDANVFVRPEGKNTDEPLRMRVVGIDDHYLDVYHIALAEGRNFSKDMPTDADQAVILNEAAKKVIGWETAVNKTVKIGSTDYKVVGVVRDYNTESLVNEVRPLIHFYRTTESSSLRFISMRINTRDPGSLIRYVKEKYAAADPGREFTYYFMDDHFNQLYAAQDRMLKVTAYFSLVAIIIACLGLLGLASYSIIQRTKEIGIRKTLGASVASICVLISRKFTILLIIANVIAWPVAYLLMKRWLEDFAYRIGMSWWLFILAGISALLIAMITISFQTIRAAIANPVNSLRTE